MVKNQLTNCNTKTALINLGTHSLSTCLVVVLLFLGGCKQMSELDNKGIVKFNGSSFSGRFII